MRISLEAFLQELGLAWQRLSLYQEGHPARDQVVTRAQAVLAALTAARGVVSVGVARDGFVGRDEKVSAGPVRRLAEALYVRDVAVVRFEEGAGTEDLKRFLQEVPRGRSSEDDPPLWDVVAARGVSLVRLEPVDLSYVEAEGEEGEQGQAEAAGGEVGAGPLWDSLLRAVLVADPARGDEEELDALGRGTSLRGVVDLVERILSRYEGRSGSGTAAGPGAAAGGSGGGGVAAAEGPEGAGALTEAEALEALAGSIGGTVASRLTSAASRGTSSGSPPGSVDATDRGGSLLATGHQVAELLDALPEALGEIVLDRAVSELVARSRASEEGPGEGAPHTTGDLERAEGFRTLSESLPAIQVIAALRRVRAAGVSFAPSVVALVDGLISHAGKGRSADTSAAELAGELAALFGEDDLDRRLPGDEEIDRIALDLARVPATEPDPEALSLRVESLDPRRQLLQLSLTLLDLLERPFLKRPAQVAIVRRLGEVFRSLLAEGRLAQAMRIPERLQELRGRDSTAEAAELGFAELRRPESAVAFLERPDDLPTSAASVALRLAELLGYEILDGLLEAMCAEEDLSRRRHIFDLMVSLGSPVVPRAEALLRDERWYVRRNMLSLLRKVGGELRPEILRHGLAHDDPRVRLEAVKALGQRETPVELIERAVKDPDPKVAQAALSAIGNQRLTAGVAPLLDLLEPLDPFGRQRALRTRALEALGQVGEPAALERIAHFLRPWFSPVSKEERRAAYASLAGYPPESRRRWIERGRWSSDPEVRAVCREIRRSTESAS